jgi:hypothetical protein
MVIFSLSSKKLKDCLLLIFPLLSLPVRKYSSAIFYLNSCICILFKWDYSKCRKRMIVFISSQSKNSFWIVWKKNCIIFFENVKIAFKKKIQCEFWNKNNKNYKINVWSSIWKLCSTLLHHLQSKETYTLKKIMT